MNYKPMIAASIAIAAAALAVSSVVFVLDTGGIEKGAQVQNSNSDSHTAASSASSHDDNDSKPSEKTISVQGKAQTSVQPDLLNIRFGVQTQKETAQDALESNSQLMNRVVSAIEQLRISKDQISTSSFSIDPIYDSVKEPGTGRHSRELVGYRVSNVIHVETPKKDSAASIIDSAVKAGANRVDSVYFSIEQQREEQIRDDLLQDAVLDAKSKAQKMLGPLDQKITGVKSVSMSSFDIPRPQKYHQARGALESADSSTPIFSDEHKVTANAEVVFLIDDKSASNTG